MNWSYSMLHTAYDYCSTAGETLQIGPASLRGCMIWSC
uniref:Uncharacterized protein n=1 Tax=Arundo donax TaxID=35708 RepID=A0A0A9CBU5_ARUDO